MLSDPETATKAPSRVLSRATAQSGNVAPTTGLRPTSIFSFVGNSTAGGRPRGTAGACVVLLQLAAALPTCGATATFTPVDPTSVLAGVDVLFDVTVAVDTLTSFNTADIIIGSNTAGDIAFAYSAAWSAAFGFVAPPSFDVGFYSQDVAVGGNNADPVGSTLLLGTVTVDTTAMPAGAHNVLISHSIDGTSNLSLDGTTPEPLEGTGLFTIVASGTCVIDGITYVDGERNPTNDCEVCSPTASITSWSSLSGVPCDDGFFCTVTATCDAGVCVGSGTPCSGGEFCDEVCDECTNPQSCPPVTTAAEGVRFLAVTPAAIVNPVALRVTGLSANNACISKYVGADGRLQDTPLFQTPAQWMTVHVGGSSVIPGALYAVRTDCGAVESVCTVVRTFDWGNVNDANLPNLDDILLILAGFSGNFTFAMPQALELLPCDPSFDNIVINLDDILGVLAAFAGSEYSAVCLLPCN